MPEKVVRELVGDRRGDLVLGKPEALELAAGLELHDPPLLALLAIPMSAVNPRTGRFVNLLVGVFVCMIYSNLINIVQAWIAQGKVPWVVGMVGVHGGMIVLVVVLLARRIGYLRLPVLARAA